MSRHVTPPVQSSPAQSGCPTSGSTSAGRRRVGRAAPIPSSEHLSNFFQPVPKWKLYMSKILHHHSPVDNQHANMLSTSAKMSQDDIKTSPILSASILATKKSKSAMSSDAKLWSSFMKMLFIHNHSMIQILSQYDKLYAYLHKCIIIAKP